MTHLGVLSWLVDRIGKQCSGSLCVISPGIQALDRMEALIELKPGALVEFNERKPGGKCNGENDCK